MTGWWWWWLKAHRACRIPIFTSGWSNRGEVGQTRTYLFQKQLAVGAQTGDEVFGEAEKRAEHIDGQVLPGRALQHEADDEEATILNHVLLHRLRGFDQFADKSEQLGTNTRSFVS